MYIDSSDMRPPSALFASDWNPAMWIGGAAVSLGAHLLGPLLTLLLFSAAAFVDISEDPALVDPEKVVEARFVKLGKKFDPREMPDRVVPRKSTRLDKSKVVSKNMNPEKPKHKPDAGPEDAEEDLLARLGDRAHAFAELAEKREEEGDPEGIEGGTEKEAKAGDIYRGKLYIYFHRGWAAPATVDPEAMKGKVAQIQVVIGRDLQLGPARLVRSSGEPLLDQAALNHVNGLRAAEAEVPEPPAEVADKYLAKPIPVNFRWDKTR